MENNFILKTILYYGLLKRRSLPWTFEGLETFQISLARNLQHRVENLFTLFHELIIFLKRGVKGWSKMLNCNSSRIRIDSTVSETWKDIKKEIHCENPTSIWLFFNSSIQNGFVGIPFGKRFCRTMYSQCRWLEGRFDMLILLCSYHLFSFIIPFL